MHKKTTLIVLFALLIPLFFTASKGQSKSEQDLNALMEKYYTVLKTAKENYVEEIEADKLVTEAVKATLKELDPHSVYLPPKKLKSEDEKFRGNFDGIGIRFSVIEDTITVVSPIAGGPSERLGIQAGDKIVKIEGDDAVGLSNDSIQSRLRGPKGTEVDVDIKRAFEDELLHFEIIRDKIPLYSVDASFIINGSDVGYVSINRFMRTTHRELLDSLKKLDKKGMEKLILDLRGNPGGYLKQAFLVADEFIPPGHKIVYTKGRKEDFNENYYSRPNGKYEDIPIVVLIDAGSASASEIVSGAIQDLDRGLIVGVTSYGKGLVQRQYRLRDKSGFRITIAKYYTPSGRCIQRPYEDEEKYRALSGRLNLEEGKNINHQLEEMEIEENSDSLPPIYKTRTGRKVIGGGGITPDYIVKYDTLTKLSRNIRAKNLIFIFTQNYLDAHKLEFEEKYKNNFKEFLTDFEFDVENMEGLKVLAESKEIEWNEEQYETDAEYLKTILKSSIARSVWGNNESKQAILPINEQATTALDLFPEAKKMVVLD